MALSPQVSNWVPQQEVTAAEMLLCTNDLYQRLGLMSTIQPFILNGLEVSVNESGLVTVTAGAAISPNMTTPAVPAAGTQIIGVLQSQQSVQIPSNTSAFGVVVLRQTGTVMTTSPNIIISSALVYISTSNSAYPAIGPNDVPLIGVYVTGTSPSQGFELDMGQRAVSTETYYQAIQGINYFENSNLQLWPYGNGPIAASANSTPICQNFAIYSTGLIAPTDFTATRYTLSSEERAVIPNSPQYGVTLSRTVADSTAVAFDCWEQRQYPYWLLNGKTITRSFWIKATSSSTLTATLRVGYNPQDAEIVIPFIQPSQEITSDNTFRLYTFTYAVPELTDILGETNLNYITSKLCFSTIDQTYTAVICEDYNCGGSFYITPQSTPANPNLIGATLNDTLIGQITPNTATFTTAFGDGTAPTEDNQFVDKSYAFGLSAQLTESTSSSQIINFPGFKVQCFQITMPAGGGTGSFLGVDLIENLTKVISISVIGTVNQNTGGDTLFPIFFVNPIQNVDSEFYRVEVEMQSNIQQDGVQAVPAFLQVWGY